MRTLYRNARLPDAPSACSALLVEDATIAWLGAAEDAPSAAGAEVVDLAQALVLPAFVDAHVHLTATGLALSGLDLTAVSSVAELLDRVERAARSANGRPLLGSGWDESAWPEARPPTRSELDRAAYGGAVYLARVDVHSAVVSSALLAAVPGIDALAGYDPDGWLRRDAHDAAREAAHAALTAATRVTAQRAALHHAAAHGIASVHEMAGPAISSTDDLQSALALSDTEAVPEVVGYWGELFGIDTALALGAVGAAGDLFCDGSLGSHTAALAEPYADRPGFAGELRFDTADVAEHIRRCAAAGLQAGFHAIGDAAVEQVLDALELARASVTPPRVRIEHAEMVRDPARFAASGAIASVQPAFDATWGGPTGIYAERLGAERAAGLNDFAALAAAGVPLAFGSDSPVTAIAPWAALRAAVRPHRAGSALVATAAFAAHTRGGRHAAGQSETGALTAGAPATFAIWAAGPGSAADVLDRDELPRCLRTVRAGRLIHDELGPAP